MGVGSPDELGETATNYMIRLQAHRQSDVERDNMIQVSRITFWGGRRFFVDAWLIQMCAVGAHLSLRSPGEGLSAQVR